MASRWCFFAVSAQKTHGKAFKYAFGALVLRLKTTAWKIANHIIFFPVWFNKWKVDCDSRESFYFLSVWFNKWIVDQDSRLSPWSLEATVLGLKGFVGVRCPKSLLANLAQVTWFLGAKLELRGVLASSRALKSTPEWRHNGFFL